MLARVDVEFMGGLGRNLGLIKFLGGLLGFVLIHGFKEKGKTLRSEKFILDLYFIKHSSDYVWDQLLAELDRYQSERTGLLWFLDTIW